MKTQLLTAAICGLLLTMGSASAQSTNFVLACSPAVAAGPTCVAVADVNGDGKPDLICASGILGGTGALTVLTNDGTGVFSSNATITFSGAVSCVVAADVNGDGKPDLICLADVANEGLFIYTNNGAGVFGSNAAFDIGFSTSPQSLAIADVNGDGKPDILISVAAPIVYTNNGSGKFSFNTNLPVAVDPQSLVAADVDGNGSIDVVCGGGPNLDPSVFEVFLNNGRGVLTSNFVFNTGENATCLVPADVNSDGKIDLVCYDIVTKTLGVFTNLGGGTFFRRTNSVPAGITNLSWIAAADLNQDKKVDLIFADPKANTLTVFTNDGSGFFGSNATLNVGTKPVFVLAADVNGDGKPDLISANQSDNTLTVLTNATVIPVPPLTIVQVGNQSAVFWPATPWNFVLQTTTNLASSNWTTVTDGTLNICITVTNSSPAAFYRLQRQ